MEFTNSITSNDEPAVQRVSFFIEGGKKLGIVGRTGS